jgi:hypothetical protein
VPLLRPGPDGARIWVGGPVPPGSSAITLGRLIIVRRRAAGDARLLRHELVHVRQWRRLGVVGFLRRYLGAYVQGRWRGYGHREAYLRIPLEVEAEQEADRAPPGPSQGGPTGVG